MILSFLKSLLMEIKFLINPKLIDAKFGYAHIENDMVKIDRPTYTDYLLILKFRFLPLAVQQTEIFADYLAHKTNKDLFTLWHFLRSNIKYVADEKGYFETIKLPNYMWHNRKSGGGDCEDFALFVSAVLTNWKVPHELIIEHLDETKAHIFVQTLDGIIIDPCNGKFNKQVRPNESKPLGIYKKTIQNFTV
jgi:hypothetical protein